MAGEKVCPISDAEWSAMMGLPYLQRCLYMALRWYMDVSSRMVGIKRGISLQGLCEELFVEPAPGRVDSGSPTKKAVRSALQQLEKHGLIQPCGNGEVLAFLLPKAGGISVRSKLKGHKRGTVSGHAMGHDESLEQQGFQDDKGHAKGQGVNGLKGHTSEVRVNHPCKQASAADMQPVDKKLSTVPVLPLLADASVADWLRRKEFERGCPAKVVTSEVRKAGWIERGVTAEDIADAYAIAVQGRVGTKNPAPINVPYVDSIIARLMSERRSAGVCEAAAGSTGGQGAVAKAQEAAQRMGLVGRDGSETDAQFVARVADEAEAVRLGVPGRQAGESAGLFLARLSDARLAARKEVKRG